MTSWKLCCTGPLHNARVTAKKEKKKGQRIVVTKPIVILFATLVMDGICATALGLRGRALFCLFRCIVVRVASVSRYGFPRHRCLAPDTMKTPITPPFSFLFRIIFLYCITEHFLCYSSYGAERCGWMAPGAIIEEFPVHRWYLHDFSVGLVSQSRIS